jgi:glyoxylase-like metal-dependent hydrolase (beta-lactamase superfamily II)
MSEPRPIDVVFDRSFAATPGELVTVSPNIRRLLADNPGPMTFSGTCTYVVGQGEVAVIDPGPDLESHVAALLLALKDETVRHILVTHTHRDHSAAAAALRAATGAKIVGCGAAPEAAAIAGAAVVDSAQDLAYVPDAVMRDGDTVNVGQLMIEAVATPGHTGNHLSYALAAEKALFTGDHVMAWATSVIIPPDGVMGDYMHSLEKLAHRSDAIYWPGHGGPVRQPQTYVPALIHHRREREAAILAALRQGPQTVRELTARVYQGLQPPLALAAQKSALAHLLDLAERGIVRVETAAVSEASEAIWRLA